MLSIQQPSASLIIEGYKNIENRTWGPTKWNSGWVLVHSPKSFEKVDLYKSEYITKILRKIDWENLPTSCTSYETVVTVTSSPPTPPPPPPPRVSKSIVGFKKKKKVSCYFSEWCYFSARCYLSA